MLIVLAIRCCARFTYACSNKEIDLRANQEATALKELLAYRRRGLTEDEKYKARLVIRLETTKQRLAQVTAALAHSLYRGHRISLAPTHNGRIASRPRTTSPPAHPSTLRTGAPAHPPPPSVHCSPCFPLIALTGPGAQDCRDGRRGQDLPVGEPGREGCHPVAGHGSGAFHTLRILTHAYAYATPPPPFPLLSHPRHISRHRPLALSRPLPLPLLLSDRGCDGLHCHVNGRD